MKKRLPDYKPPSERFLIFLFDWSLSGTRGEGGEGVEPMLKPIPRASSFRALCEQLGGYLAQGHPSNVVKVSWHSTTPPRTTQGASTAPITVITFIMTPTPISQSVGPCAHMDQPVLWWGDGSMTTQVQREQDPSCQCHHRTATNSSAMI